MMETRRRIYGKERGAILVLALISLLVLTILSVTMFSSARMEQKMATSAGNMRRALTAADAGLQALKRDVGKFTLAEDPVTNPAGDVDGWITGLATSGDNSAGASYDTWFIESYPPPDGSGYSARVFSAYYYGAVVDGYSLEEAPGIPSGNAARARVQGTFWRIAPKN